MIPHPFRLHSGGYTGASSGGQGWRETPPWAWCPALYRGHERGTISFRSGELMAADSDTAVVEKQGNGYVARWPELDEASQGAIVEAATANLEESVELFLECADAREIHRRMNTEVVVTRFEGTRGSPPGPLRRRGLSDFHAAWICRSTASRQSYTYAALDRH